MKKYGAEFFGTFWLVLGGCGSAVLAAAFPNVGIGLLGKDKLKITFAVNLFIYEGESALGSLQVNFHKTGEENVNHSDFKSIDNFTELRGGVQEFNGNEYMFVRFVATGQFNGEDGWSILARFSDFGEPGVGKKNAGNLSDAVRFTLIDPYNNLAYDTALSFPKEQVWRVLLDGGNLTFHCED